MKFFLILPLFVATAFGQPLSNSTSTTPSVGISIQINSTTNAPVLTNNNSSINKTDLHTGESKPEAYLVHLKPKKRSRNKSAANAKNNKYLLLLRLPEDHTAAGSSVDQQQRSVDDFALNEDQQTHQQTNGLSDSIQDNGEDSAEQQQQNEQQSNNISNGQQEDQGFDDISQFARNKPMESFGQRTSLPSNSYNQQQQQNQPQQQQVNEPIEQNNDQFDDNFSQNNQQQNEQPTYFSPIKSTKQINRAPTSYVALGPSKGTQINYKTEIQHDIPVQQNNDFESPVQQNDDFSAPANQQNNDYEERAPVQQNNDFEPPVQQNDEFSAPVNQQNDEFNPPVNQQEERAPVQQSQSQEEAPIDQPVIQNNQDDGSFDQQNNIPVQSQDDNFEQPDIQPQVQEPVQQNIQEPVQQNIQEPVQQNIQEQVQEEKIPVQQTEAPVVQQEEKKVPVLLISLPEQQKQEEIGDEQPIIQEPQPTKGRPSIKGEAKSTKSSVKSQKGGVKRRNKSNGATKSPGNYARGAVTQQHQQQQQPQQQQPIKSASSGVKGGKSGRKSSKTFNPRPVIQQPVQQTVQEIQPQPVKGEQKSMILNTKTNHPTKGSTASMSFVMGPAALSKNSGSSKNNVDSGYKYLNNNNNGGIKGSPRKSPPQQRPVGKTSPRKTVEQQPIQQDIQQQEIIPQAPVQQKIPEQKEIQQQQQEVNFIPLPPQQQQEVKGRPSPQVQQTISNNQESVKGYRPSPPMQQPIQQQQQQQNYGNIKGKSKGQSGYNRGFQGIKGGKSNDGGYNQKRPAIQQPISQGPVKGNAQVQTPNYQQQQNYGGTKEMSPEQISYARREPVKPRPFPPSPANVAKQYPGPSKSVAEQPYGQRRPQFDDDHEIVPIVGGGGYGNNQNNQNNPINQNQNNQNNGGYGNNNVQIPFNRPQQINTGYNNNAQQQQQQQQINNVPIKMNNNNNYGGQEPFRPIMPEQRPINNYGQQQEPQRPMNNYGQQQEPQRPMNNYGQQQEPQRQMYNMRQIMQQPQQVHFNNNNNFNNNYGQLQQASYQQQLRQPYFNTKQNQQSLSSNTRYNFAPSETAKTPRTSLNKKLVLLLFNRSELEKNRMFKQDHLAGDALNNHQIYKSKA